jgi:hypothetical protein
MYGTFKHSRNWGPLSELDALTVMYCSYKPANEGQVSRSRSY